MRHQRFVSMLTGMVVLAVSAVGIPVGASPGMLDPGFGSGGAVVGPPASGEVVGLAVQPDGRVVVVEQNVFTPPPRFRFARYFPDGQIDPSLLTPPDIVDSVFDLVAGADGKLWLGVHQAAGFGVWRLQSDGAPDATFGDNGFAGLDVAVPLHLALDGAGRVVVAGSGQSPSSGAVMERLDASGRLDSSFGGSGAVVRRDLLGFAGLTISGDGGILAVGAHQCQPPEIDRYLANGTPDPGFGHGGTAPVRMTVDAGVAGGCGDVFVSGAAAEPDGGVAVAVIDSFSPQPVVVAALGRDGSQLFATRRLANCGFAPLDPPDGSLVRAPTGDLIVTSNAIGGLVVTALRGDGSPDPSFAVGGVSSTNIYRLSGGVGDAFFLGGGSGGRATSVLAPDGSVVTAGDVINLSSPGNRRRVLFRTETSVQSPGTTSDAIAGCPARGYWLARADGSVSAFGDTGTLGSSGALRVNSPIVGVAPTPTGDGYWLVASDGGIFSFGDAAFFGSTGALRLKAPIVGVAPTPSGHGYWLVASDGGIFSFGDAAFFGSTGALRLNRPIVGMAPTPSGHGYWLVAADGGIFSFGDAAFFGSTGALRLKAPIVGMAPTPTGDGYWLVASDGGIFSFGGFENTFFWGSGGALSLRSPVVGMAASGGSGYWLVATDGGVFTFGTASFLGSTGSASASQPVIGLAVR